MLPSLPQQPLSLGTPNAEGRTERHNERDRTEDEELRGLQSMTENDIQPVLVESIELLQDPSTSLYSCHLFLLSQAVCIEL